MYDVSYFCVVGTPWKKNQDRVLVNGEILADGIRHLQRKDRLHCFVADGVGSMENSEHAAEFVLGCLSELYQETTSQDREVVTALLKDTNTKLVNLNMQQSIYRDSATTLCGLIIDQKGLLQVNVGDSEILVYRKGVLTRLTKPQVIDELAFNSPITSLLGSSRDSMTIDLNSPYHALSNDDILIVTTDGLRKAIGTKDLVNVLERDIPLSQRIEELLTMLTAVPSPDNMGAIFIIIADYKVTQF